MPRRKRELPATCASAKSILWSVQIAKWPILALLAATSSLNAQSLDFEFYRARVEPIFVTKRPEHTRCVVCHSEGKRPFNLQKLAPGATQFTEEQSRRNFETVTKLVVPGKPESSVLLLHPLAHSAGG